MALFFEARKMISDSCMVLIRAGFQAASCNNTDLQGKDLPSKEVSRAIRSPK
jgi:hypothetical protein